MWINQRNKEQRTVINPFGICLLVVTVLFCVLFSASATQTQVVRVGYAVAAGQIEEQNGSFIGYAPDYLDAVAEYTGWEYEYVPGSVTENLERLSRGEVDLLCLFRQTESREEQFIFSELPATYDYTAIRAAAGSDFYYGDTVQLDGAKAGIVADSIHGKALEEYLSEYGVSCQLVSFSTAAELEAALQNGQVDLMATEGLSAYENTKLIKRLETSGAYFMTGRQNRALMDELDQAMQQIRVDRPELESELLEKYFSSSSGDLMFTRQEQEYIDTAEPIVVKSFDHRRPLCYVDESGQMTGILPEYLDMLGEINGLEFIHEKAEEDTLNETLAVLPEKDFVVIGTERDLASVGLDEEILKSDAIMETGYAYIRRSGDAADIGQDDYVFALGRTMSYLEESLLQEVPSGSVRYYNTPEGCMRALIRGEADISIQNEHVGIYLLQKPVYLDELVMVEGFEVEQAVRVYAPAEYHTLISVLNKTMAAVGESESNHYISGIIPNHAYEHGVSDFLYEYIGWVAAGAVLLAVAALVYRRVVALKREKALSEEQQRKYQIDALTGLYSRNYFLEQAEEKIRQSREEMDIIRLNVCNFKAINALYGEEAGNQLLRQIGETLLRDGQQFDFIAGHFVADQFFLCVPHKSFDQLPWASRISIPWLDMELSLVYGVYPVDLQKDIPLNVMCDRANMALALRDKASTEYIFWYSGETLKETLREQQIEREMESAIAQRQFMIYVQPKYDVDTGRVAGGEALVRWKHPEWGIVSPGEFIPVFERNGFIRKLDYYVWEETCAFIQEARKRGRKVPPISVNVSRIHFYGSELQNKLEELMARYGLSHDDIELEITETIYAEDAGIILEKCGQLRAAGFKLSMDDFGSGYSSLSMLKELPLDVIKMDLRFLTGGQDGEQQKKGRSILSALVWMTHELGLQIVVEGVETEEQRGFIRELGGCIAQGFLYARPLPSLDFEALLEANGREEAKP